MKRPLLRWIVLVLLGLGLMFRIANLDQRVYWVDEVATSIRVAGYTREEVVQTLATGEIWAIATVQYYQQLTPERDWADTFDALRQSPEHAPLYFILARLWVQRFGSSVAAIRSLSVVCSLLALPCFYWLAVELFKSPPVGWMAVGLLSVSPFFVAYAQEARPYSLWSVTLLLSGIALLRAMRLKTKASWGLYALTLAIALYTSLLSVFVVVGLGIYVVFMARFASLPSQFAGRMRHYWGATGLAVLAFSPWLMVIAQHWGTLHDNTTWARSPLNPLAMVAIWLYSLAIIVFDVPVSVDLSIETVMKGIVASTVLAIMGYAVYWLWVTASRRIGLFVIVLIISTPTALISLDLIRGGQASATPRYLVPCQLGMLLALAYLLGDRLTLFSRRRTMIGITGFLLTLSLWSCIGNLSRTPDYQKARNQANPAIAAVLNQAPAPILIAEPEYAIDVVSLSYALNSDTRIQIVSADEAVFQRDPEHDYDDSVFILNPSDALRRRIGRSDRFDLEQIYQPELLTPDDIHLSLWQLQVDSNYESR
ncbi:MAG: glycosyltransferase family 39 protein [Elainellaceae cyanobacterium]